MEELTLRLPAEMKETLQTDAAQRGVTVSEHVRDILDVYHGKEAMKEPPELDISYRHTVERGGSASNRNTETTKTDSEEIGSFMYGSRSILS